MNHDWEVAVREVWPLSGRPWVAVWGELTRGDNVEKGDRFVVETATGRVKGVIEGIELHRLLHAPKSWVGLLVGKPVADVVGPGSRIIGTSSRGSVPG